MAARRESDAEAILEQASHDEQTPLIRHDSDSTEPPTAPVPLSFRRGLTILLTMGALIFIQGI